MIMWWLKTRKLLHRMEKPWRHGGSRNPDGNHGPWVGMLTDSLLSLFRARIFRSSAKKQEKGGGIILRVGRSLKGHLKGRTSLIMINSSARPECKKGESAAMPYASDVVIHPGVIRHCQKGFIIDSLSCSTIMSLKEMAFERFMRFRITYSAEHGVVQ